MYTPTTTTRRRHDHSDGWMGVNITVAGDSIKRHTPTHSASQSASQPARKHQRHKVEVREEEYYLYEIYITHASLVSVAALAVHSPVDAMPCHGGQTGRCTHEGGSRKWVPVIMIRATTEVQYILRSTIWMGICVLRLNICQFDDMPFDWIFGLQSSTSCLPHSAPAPEYY